MTSESEAIGGAIEFTFDWYERFLEQLGERYEPTDYDGSPTPGEVVFRHDVDLSPSKALEMGRIEAKLGIESTYFVLVTSPLYNVFHYPNREVLAELQLLGHDVGLHFSTHQYWSDEPSETDLVDRVEAEQELLEQAIGDVSPAVSFHRPPDWIVGRSFDSFTSAYADRFFSEVAYHGDSGQRWREQTPPADDADAAQVLVHPGLWGEHDAGFEKRVEQALDYQIDRIREFTAAEILEDVESIERFQHCPEDR